MAAGQKFTQFAVDLGLKVHNLDTDVLKIMLTNTAPVVTNTIKADLTDIAAGNGYTAGGFDAQGVLSLVGGVAQLVCTDVVITASGGPIGPFRYAALYNDTQTSPAKPLMVFWDNGTPITVNDTEAVTLDFASTTITLS